MSVEVVLAANRGSVSITFHPEQSILARYIFDLATEPLTYGMIYISDRVMAIRGLGTLLLLPAGPDIIILRA